MKIFVTGATGVLGRRVLPLLTAEGHEVTAVARGKHDQVRSRGAEPMEVDLFDADAVRRAVDGHDVVVDLATSIPATNRMMLPWAWRNNDRLRTEAADNASRAAAEAQARYVRESIGLLYADGGGAWIDEQHPVEPVRTTRTALAAEAAAHRVTAAGGVGVALRFAQFYGHDADHTRDTVAWAQKGVAMLLGPADAFTSQIHLDDAATAVVAALAAPAGVYNVVEDEPVPTGEQVAILEQLAGRRLRTPPDWLASFGPAAALARSQRMSNAALREAAAWAPSFPSPRDGWAEVFAHDAIDP